jgi:hypothetical protein
MVRRSASNSREKLIAYSLIRICAVMAILSQGHSIFSQSSSRLQTHVAASRLYAIQKPANWRVLENNEPNRLSVQVQSPNGASSVDFVWERNNQGRSNAVQYMLAYRQMLRKSRPDVVFSGVHASADNLKCATTATFHVGQTAVRGRYYFESSPQRLSMQGYFAPHAVYSSQRVLLVNIMASLSFVKKDPRPAKPITQNDYYHPPMAQRAAPDRSLTITIPHDWDFLAGGGKIVTGSKRSAPGFLFTALQGNPLVRNAPITTGVISARYLNPSQTLVYVLQAFGHRHVEISSAARDAASIQSLAAHTGRRGEAQHILARWTSAKGVSCAGGFKVINTLPSMSGLWSTIISGVWAPAKDTYLYLDALEAVAASFSINDQYARGYIRAGMQRLRELEQETISKINELNRDREKNQKVWEDRQQTKEFSDSKWDDYRRGQSYWVSDIEGGKVYATDSWGTRDTYTGDYYEGRGYKYTHFEGDNPRYNESMREISSYELEKMSGR